MPFCPECKYEYVEGVTECPDCQVPLVESLGEGTEGNSPFGGSTTPWVARAMSAPGTTSPEDLVACWEAKDFVEAEAASAALRDQGIPCSMRQSHPLDSTGYAKGGFVHQPILHLILVPESWQVEARRVLEDVMPNLGLTPSDEMEMPEASGPDDEADEDFWPDQ